MEKTGGPYLERGESIILTTDRVRVNSVEYEVLLTTRHLILVDAGNARFQPSMYPLLSILSVKGGKTSNGEMVIILFFNETSDNDESGRMVLVFSPQPGEQRKSERDEWIKKLMKLIVSARQETQDRDNSTADQKNGIQPSLRRTFAPEMSLPYKTAPDTRPVPVEFNIIHDDPEAPAFGEAAEDEVIPATNAMEETPVMADQGSGLPDSHTPSLDTEESPVIVQEDSGLPDSHTPSLDSEESPVIVQEDSGLPDSHTPSLDTEESPVIVQEDSGLPDSHTPSLDSEESPVIVQEDSGLPDSHTPSLDSEESPVIVQEDSGLPDSHTPSLDTEESPVVNQEDSGLPEMITPPEGPDTGASTGSQEENTGSTIIPEPSTREEIPVFTQKDTLYPDLPLPSEQIVMGSSQDSFVEEPEIPEGKTLLAEGVQESSEQPVADVTPDTPETPPPTRGSGNRWRAFLAVTAIIMVILVIAAAGIYYSANRAPPVVEPVPTPTPTFHQTPVPTPVIIPPTGIWVRVVYPGSYYGWVGSPGSLRGINSSGDQLYRMPESAETIQVNMYKQDNSGNPLTIEVYRAGKMINNRTISVPMGSIELLVDAKTGNPPGLTPTVTPSGNQTGSGSGRIMYF